MMNNILLTGFVPFATASINPSWEVVKDYHQTKFANKFNVYALQIPCDFQNGIITLEQAIIQYNPSYIVSIGVFGGKTDITLEHVAINLLNTTIADNNNYIPQNNQIITDGPLAYLSKLPLDLIYQTLNNNGIPASNSYSADIFLCNQLFYGLMHLIATKYNNIIGGFIHVPYLPEQAAKYQLNNASVLTQTSIPSMSLVTMKQAIEHILNILVKTNNILNAGR